MQSFRVLCCFVFAILALSGVHGEFPPPSNVLDGRCFMDEVAEDVWRVGATLDGTYAPDSQCWWEFVAPIIDITLEGVRTEQSFDGFCIYNDDAAPQGVFSTGVAYDQCRSGLGAPSPAYGYLFEGFSPIGEVAYITACNRTSLYFFSDAAAQFRGFEAVVTLRNDSQCVIPYAGATSVASLGWEDSPDGWLSSSSLSSDTNNTLSSLTPISGIGFVLLLFLVCCLPCIICCIIPGVIFLLITFGIITACNSSNNRNNRNNNNNGNNNGSNNRGGGSGNAGQNVNDNSTVIVHTPGVKKYSGEEPPSYE